MALFSTAYFPPLSYMKELIHASKASIEQHETYPKQTYRNRCYIYTANGRLPLIVPVIKTNGNRTKTKDIKIAYDEKWQQNHIRALESAYSASAYYLFYKDEIETIISGGYEYLTDLNNAILTKLLDLIHIKKQLSYTKNFQKESNQETDLRNAFSPKKWPHATVKKYFQVFSHKHGFIPDLSILDLLFNLGPETYNHLSSNY